MRKIINTALRTPSTVTVINQISIGVPGVKKTFITAVNKTIMGVGSQFDGPLGRRTLTTVYALANKVFAFN